MFDSEVGEISIAQLLEGGPIEFILPSYQRGYRWREKQIQALIDDFSEKWKDGHEGEYLLQPIVVGRGTSDKSFVVIDGQQRLRTLRELLSGRVPDKVLWSIGQKDEAFEKELLTRACLKNCQRVVADDANRDKLNKIFPSHLCDVKLIYYNISVGEHSADREQHKVFEDMNANKIGLTDAELIRALYLGSQSTISGHEIAAEWEQIELQLQNDAFWYMFNGEEPNTATRIDKLFSILTGTENSDGKHPAYHALERKVRQETNALRDFWVQVLNLFWMLQYCYKNIYAYHYIGWIRHTTGVSFSTLWKLYQQDRPKFVNNLRLIILGRKNEIENLPSDIASIATLDLTSKMDAKAMDAPLRYMYKPSDEDGDVPKELQGQSNIHSAPSDLVKLFLLFNLETLNQTFSKTCNVDERTVENRWELSGVEYYRFPFSLYRDQNWNIEHIGSHTDTPMDPRVDFKECVEWAIDVLLLDEATKLKNEVAEWLFPFASDTRYLEVVQRMGLSTFSANDYLIAGERRDLQDFPSLYKKWVGEFPVGAIMVQTEKNALGNLTLLDEKTNKSYKNAIFGRKRREMLDVHIADEKHEFRFIPPCTVDVLCQRYTPTPLSRLLWSQNDSECHYRRIVSVLGKMWKDASDGKNQ